MGVARLMGLGYGRGQTNELGLWAWSCCWEGVVGVVRVLQVGLWAGPDCWAGLAFSGAGLMIQVLIR